MFLNRATLLRPGRSDSDWRAAQRGSCAAHPGVWPRLLRGLPQLHAAVRPVNIFGDCQPPKLQAVRSSAEKAIEESPAVDDKCENMQLCDWVLAWPGRAGRCGRAGPGSGWSARSAGSPAPSRAATRARCPWSTTSSALELGLGRIICRSSTPYRMASAIINALLDNDDDDEHIISRMYSSTAARLDLGSLRAVAIQPLCSLCASTI